MENTHQHAVGRLASKVLLTDAQRQLEDDGFLLVEDLCDPDFVTQLFEVSASRSDKVMAARPALTRWCSVRPGAGIFLSRRVNLAWMSTRYPGDR